MLILAIIVAGMFVGWIVQLLLGRSNRQVDWTMAIVAGVVGSFLGGLIASLIAGDGFDIRPSGVIGSFVGALIITLIWQQVNTKRRADARAEADKKPWDKN